MHHTRQMIVDAIQGSEYLTVRLGEGDTAWAADYLRPGATHNVFGPGVVTYREGVGVPAFLAAFDPLADDGDPRCDVTSPDGDVCRLVAGDHLAHYWGETDGSDTHPITVADQRVEERGKP